MNETATMTEFVARTRPATGAHVTPNGAAFLVWAPNATRSVEVVLDADGTRHALSQRGDGYWGATVPGIVAGARYRYRLDGGEAFPDPCSRFQPEGVHGPSEVVDPSTYAWHDDGWAGLSSAGLVVYELHVGTMTPEGTYAALERELPALRSLGVTAIELMPLAECPGRWNWGYDGVDLWAPSHNYGTPDELRRLVDTAHRLGLGVILDLVYNHFGPDGNYLSVYASDYFTDRHTTPWGNAINFDGPNSRPVRDFVIGNAVHWATEYHIDGFRLDATHAIVDDSIPHALAEMTAAVRDAVAPREAVVLAEDDRNDVSLVASPLRGGWGLDAIWADDFHHELHVMMTGERDGYFANYEGTPASVAHVIRNALTFQGQPWDGGDPRGSTVTDEPGSAFVFCIQNHDQVGNRPLGDRLSTQVDVGTYHVASALLLCAPETPMLFMGQEFRATTPFQYFTDHHGELGRLVSEGRTQEFAYFSGLGEAEVPDPQAESTFLASKLNLAERETNAGTLALYQDLLELIRDDAVLAIRDRISTVTVTRDRLILLFRTNGEQHRLLLANFGDDTRLALQGLGEGILDPPRGAHILIDTGNERYGGDGAAVVAEGGIRLAGASAVLLGW